MKANHDLLWMILLFLFYETQDEGIFRNIILGLYVLSFISYSYNRYKNQ